MAGEGEDGSSVQWSEKFFESLYGAALLRYLAVSHFGRGRGEWEEGEHPQFWLKLVDSEVERQSEEIRRLYAKGKGGKAEDLRGDMAKLLTASGRRVLERLYPGAVHTVAAEGA